MDRHKLHRRITISSTKYSFYSLKAMYSEGFKSIDTFPFSYKILLESLVRGFTENRVTEEDLCRFASIDPLKGGKGITVPFHPSRVLLQDFTGVPCLVDLAAMRTAVKGDPENINPLIPVDMVIDHSLQVDAYGSVDAENINMNHEFKRNRERYEFLKWGEVNFKNFRIIPPGSGICHQVNLEYLGKVVMMKEVSREMVLFPDTVIGTDSHTPMINGLGILGWGVGGIEAEAAMLGQPVFMEAPDVIGVRLVNRPEPGVTATDLVLNITSKLRELGVVGKFVEYFGPGLDHLSVTDRATISNMAPEYGATMGFFPADDAVLDYLRITGRSEEHINIVESYLKEQGLFRTKDSPEPGFRDVLEIDLSKITPVIAGPKRPQDKIPLGEVKSKWHDLITSPMKKGGFLDADPEQAQGDLSEQHGKVIIAAITSCTNTSNPKVLLAAGLLAKKAAGLGLSRKPWVKTSFAPGSLVVTEYLERAGLLESLEALGFHVVGYGCTTCIGNSGPVDNEQTGMAEKGAVFASVLSGNRNFEGRISPAVKANFLASPPLVVAYAIAGRIDIDLYAEPLGQDNLGTNIFLKDIWPDSKDVESLNQQLLHRDLFLEKYTQIERSNPRWNKIPVKGGAKYQWDEKSTYIKEPPFFKHIDTDGAVTPIAGAKVLVWAGDSTTTDHISPAGTIDPSSPAGKYLISLGVGPDNFNSYGSRRGNDKVMTRGTFANVRFRNLLVPGTEGSVTRHFPSGKKMDIYEASLKYRKEDTPVIILAGKDYGMGSSRDWAAKGVSLLGVKAVLAESYERIHRSNLVGMGVLPLQFKNGESVEKIGLKGDETFTIQLNEDLKPGGDVHVKAETLEGKEKIFMTVCRLDNREEIEYYRHGGILQSVMLRLADTI